MKTRKMLPLHDGNINIEEVASELDSNLDRRVCRLNELETLNGVGGWTPLNAACHHRNWDVAMFLMERGASVNRANDVSVLYWRIIVEI